MYLRHMYKYSKKPVLKDRYHERPVLKQHMPCAEIAVQCTCISIEY